MHSMFITVHMYTDSHTCICMHCRAATLGRFEVIQALSAYGADFTVSTTSGENAVYYATAAYKLLCVRFLGQRGESYVTLLPLPATISLVCVHKHTHCYHMH